jgi:PAS domain S-box-containing protein
MVAFPDHVDGRLVARLGEQLLEVLRQGAKLVVADMSGTAWCDPACAEMLVRVYQKALINQAELRLVVSGAEVAQLVTAAGLDRLVSVFPSVQAATSDGLRGATSSPGPARQASPAPQAATGALGGGRGQRQLGAAVLRQLIDVLDDGILLADADGTIVLGSRRLTAMFGYADGELAGQPVEVLVPPGLRELHRADRAGYGEHPVPRPMADRLRMSGVGKDGATRPVTITLSPVPTAGGPLILAVVRDATQAARRDDLASLAWATAGEREHQTDALHDRVVRALFHVGLSLQAAADQPAELARERITDALVRLDQVIHDVRDHLFRRGGDSAG